MDGITLKVEGESYPLTSADEITMDEAIVLHDYSGITLDQLEDLEGFNPKVIAAFMHIAIARKRPDLKATELRKMVGAVKVNDLAEAFEEAEKRVDARPPVLNEGESGKPASSGGNGRKDGESSPDFSPHDSSGLAA